MHVLPIFVAQLLRLHYNKEKKKIFLLFLFILLDKNAGGGKMKCQKNFKARGYFKIVFPKARFEICHHWGPRKF